MKRLIIRFFAAVAHYLGLWHFLYLLVKLKRQPMLVTFTYHRIVDGATTDDYYMFYEKGLDYRAFDRQLKLISKYFDICTLEEFIEYASGKKELKRHTALLTTDDADSEYIEYALPILKKYNFPSVIFAPTSFIGTKKRFWHVDISEIVRNCDAASWEDIQSSATILFLPDSIREIISRPFPDNEILKTKLARELNRILDKVPDNDVEQIITSWKALITIERPLTIHCMNWDQLKFLSGENTNIQSHTHSHRKLARLTRDEIFEELTHSRAEIETHLGQTVSAICYPQGSYSDKVVDVAAKTGYTVGFSTVPSVCQYPMNETDILKIPRYGLDTTNMIDIDFDLARIASHHLSGGIK